MLLFEGTLRTFPLMFINDTLIVVGETEGDVISTTGGVSFLYIIDLKSFDEPALLVAVIIILLTPSSNKIADVNASVAR